MTAAPQIPDAEQRTERNAALRITGADTGFWDDHGRPAPWPDDIDEWRPSTSETISEDPTGQPL
jgi:hypothetical protein